MNARQQRSWSFPTTLIRDQSILALGVWAAFVVVILGITIGIDYFDTISGSVWDPSATQVVRWYLLFIGVYLSDTLLPLHIAHGKTRRDFAIEGLIFTVCLSAVAAALVTIGYALEAGLYQVMDWPREIGGNHWFSSVSEFPLIFIEFWLLFVIWMLGGAFIAAAFYRSSDAGGGALLVAVMIAGITDIALGGSWGPLGFVVDRIFNAPSVPGPVSIVLIIGSILAFLGLSWSVIRDIPLKSK